MTDKPKRRRIPDRVSLEPGYNPANDATVRALAEVPTDDEALRNEIERIAIAQTPNGPKDTDRAAPPDQESS